jgi:hypothetical protein
MPPLTIATSKKTTPSMKVGSPMANPNSKKTVKTPKRAPIDKGPKRIAFSDFMALPSEIRAEMDSMLLNNDKLSDVVHYLHEKAQVLQDKQKPSLQRQLFRYREELIEPRQLMIAAKFTDNDTVKRMAAKVDALVARFEPITEVERLVHLQATRVAKMALLEAKGPGLLDSQHKNIALLHTMLKDLANLHMDIGLLRKVPMKVDHSVTPELQGEYETMKVDTQERDATIKALEILRSEGMLDDDALLGDFGIAR